MSTFIIALVIMMICSIIYRRYVPVFGIPCGKNKSNAIALDIRDYNEHEPMERSDLKLPYAYLKRYKNEIPKQHLHVIANDRIELNLGLRFLLRHGYRVISYEISNCPCRKGREFNGV